MCKNLKKMFFMSGMPRAGSTVLANILNQNPAIYASQTSGLSDTLVWVRNTWDKIIEHQAMDRELATKRKRQVLEGMINSYYSDTERPVVVDKSRNWLAHIEMLEWILGKKIKIIVPIRTVPEVLASYELLWRKTSASRQMPQEKGNYLKTQTVMERCSLLMEPEQPVGLAYRRILDAKQRGLADRMWYMDFDHLTANPGETIKHLYDFLEIKHYPHDFDNIKQVTRENDDLIGIPGLHDIRPRIDLIKPRATTVLGPEVTEIFARYKFN